MKTVFRFLWTPACYIIAALQIWGEHKGWLEGRKTETQDFKFEQDEHYVPVYAPLQAKDGNVFLLPWERLN